MHKPKLLLIALGGTISCTLDENGAALPTLGAEDIINKVPQVFDYATIETMQLRQVSSCDLNLADMLELSVLLQTSEYDGFIITQGTDSMEETAFALDLLYSGDKPVVLTGAMRYPDLPGSDADANVLAAVITCVSDSKGIMLVLNDTVHAARYVKKAHSSHCDAFASGQCGPMAIISENKFIKYYQLKPGIKIDINKLDSALLAKSQAPILTSFSGDDGKAFGALAKSGDFKGVVIDALGAGHVSAELAKAIAGYPELIVLITSRTAQGSTYKHTYGAIGCEIDLQNKGAIMAGSLNAIQARIYLELLLASGLNKAAIKDLF